MKVDQPDLETEDTQRQKLPPKGKRKPNADEQDGDWGNETSPEERE